MGIKIAIGCHSYLLGEGLKKLFQGETDIDIIGIFDEGIDVKEILKLNPDIILADFNIFRAFPEDFVVDHHLKILLIGDRWSLSIADKQMYDLISRGINGILPTDANSDILKKAVRAIFSGEFWLERKLIKNVISCMNSSEKKVNLTKKEREIVTLICNGHRNKEIAQKLDISEQTVKSHCNRIYKKVGVSDRLQLALYTRRAWPGCV